MKYQLILLFGIMIFGCGPSTNKYQPRYQAIKEKIIKNRSGIESMITHLPETHQRKMSESMELVVTNDIAGFLRETKMSNQNFELFMKSVENFMLRWDTAKEFVPNDAQKRLYAEVKTKILSQEEEVRKYIKTIENSEEFSDISLKSFLNNMLAYEITEFIHQSLVTEEDFDKNFLEFKDNWSEFISTVIVLNLAEELK